MDKLTWNATHQPLRIGQPNTEPKTNVFTMEFQTSGEFLWPELHDGEVLAPDPKCVFLLLTYKCLVLLSPYKRCERFWSTNLDRNTLVVGVGTFGGWSPSKEVFCG